MELLWLHPSLQKQQDPKFIWKEAFSLRSEDFIFKKGVNIVFSKQFEIL